MEKEAERSGYESDGNRSFLCLESTFLNHSDARRICGTRPDHILPFHSGTQQKSQTGKQQQRIPSRLFRKTVFAQCVLQSDSQPGPHIAEAIELQSSVSSVQAFAFAVAFAFAFALALAFAFPSACAFAFALAFAFAFASRRQAERTASQVLNRPFHTSRLLQEQPT
jgi:lipopolysaccharide export LptBFGC system permease protein LptF